MTTQNQGFRSMGKRIADIENRALAEDSGLSELKKRIDFIPSAYPSPANTKMRIISAAGIASAAAAVLVFFLFYSSEAITVRSGDTILKEGSWISSKDETQTELLFSDGSRFLLDPKSGVRIRALHTEGAHLLLEQGAISANVVHGPATQWQLDVGPYVVTITGTRFQVGWDPNQEHFRLDMYEGSVDVQGPMITKGKSVKTGERLRSSLKDKRMSFYAEDEERVAKPHRPAETRNEVSKTQAAAPTESAVLEKSSDGKPPASPIQNKGAKRKKESAHPWLTLAEQGQYKEAVALVKKGTISQIIKTASPSELLTLGDAARHASELNLADKIYRQLRKRHPRSSQASSAAFALGVVAFDKRRAYKDAARWFDTVIKEQSGKNGLAKEAAGRLMESLNRAGDPEGAMQAARHYLKSYPKGPHAPLAERLTK